MLDTAAPQLVDLVFPPHVAPAIGYIVLVLGVALITALLVSVDAPGRR